MPILINLPKFHVFLYAIDQYLLSLAYIHSMIVSIHIHPCLGFRLGLISFEILNPI